MDEQGNAGEGPPGGGGQHQAMAVDVPLNFRNNVFVWCYEKLSTWQRNEVIVAGLNLNEHVQAAVLNDLVIYSGLCGTFLYDVKSICPREANLFYGSKQRLIHDVLSVCDRASIDQLSDIALRRAIQLFHLVPQHASCDVNALCHWLCGSNREMSDCQCAWRSAGPQISISDLEQYFQVNHEDPYDTVRRFLASCFEVLRKWSANPDSRDLYAPCMVIVQCSGTGKSRTMAEASRWVPTIYVCYRDTGELENGYPSKTPIVWDYLTAGDVSFGLGADVCCYIRAVACSQGVRDSSGVCMYDNLVLVEYDWKCFV